jgi:hypothetical protein
MRHVVRRCPNCGVEHDAFDGALGSQEGYAGRAALIGAVILGLAGFLAGGMRALALLLEARSRKE